MLTPLDIHNKDFKRSFRGYDEDEIDDFLDQVVNDYEKLYRDNDKLKKELALAEKNLEHYSKLEKNLQDTLMVAQKTADEVTTNARKSADEMRINAQKECDNLKAEAELDARRIRDKASEDVRDIVSEYDRLVREERRTIKKMRSLFNDEIARLDAAEKDIPDPDAEDASQPSVSISQAAELAERAAKIHDQNGNSDKEPDKK
ncbi:MAG: DivIVA domain-containing protein [Veillonellaceae bacterium]|nr:DivIVA domain-containing protein [Veillonellaceae bacterium]MDD6924072.1 DivIVA domain-containing protein [Veillonellaceae bacterium]